LKQQFSVSVKLLLLYLAVMNSVQLRAWIQLGWTDTNHRVEALF